MVDIPYVGPILAPIAAGVAFTAVSAFDIFSAAGGMDYVPADGTPIIGHAREMMLSAKYADPLRKMLENYEVNEPQRSAAGLDAGGSTQGGGDVHHHHHDHYDFSGASFAPGLTKGDLERMLPDVLRHAKRKGAFL